MITSYIASITRIREPMRPVNNEIKKQGQTKLQNGRDHCHFIGANSVKQTSYKPFSALGCTMRTQV